MKELLTTVLSEDENGMLNLAFHLDDQAVLTNRLDKLLLALLQARAQALPPPSKEPPMPGTELRVVLDSPWRLDPNLAGDVALSLHHPALGWVAWQFEKASARQFAQTLIAVLDSQQQAKSIV